MLLVEGLVERRLSCPVLTHAGPSQTLPQVLKVMLKVLTAGPALPLDFCTVQHIVHRAAESSALSFTSGQQQMTNETMCASACPQEPHLLCH